MKNFKKQKSLSFIMLLLVVGSCGVSALGESGNRSPHPEREMVRELSQRKDTQSVKRLRHLFSSHALQKDDQVDHFLDAEVLLALQDMSTKEARVALRQTLRDIRDRGPKPKSKAWHDERYMASMSTGIRLLGISAEEEDKKLLAELADDEKLDGSFREQSYFWMLTQKMHARKIGSLRKKLEWLYRQYTDEGGKAIPAYKSVAIERIIYRLGKDVLPILTEYANELAEKNGEKSWGVVWLRHLADNLAGKVAQKAIPEMPGKVYWRTTSEDSPRETRPTAKKPAGMLP